MSADRRGKIRLTLPALHAALGLADDVVVTGVIAAQDPQRLDVLVESPRFAWCPPLAEATIIPLADVQAGAAEG